MRIVDISTYQTNVDYALASQNLDGVLLRAGYGKNNIDDMFMTHYNGFSTHNTPIGVYWFSYATNVEEAINEANYCISAIHGLKIELPICFDFEDDSVRYAKNKGIKITKALATQIANAFLSTVELNGYYAMLYANPNFLKNYYGDLSRYDLWLAHWFEKPDLTNPPQPCGIWQYGLTEYKGFASPVDGDVGYKDYPTVIRKAGLNHLPPPDPLWYIWATSNGLLDKDEVNDPATKGDIAQMLYEYHQIFNPEDNSWGSGLLGG